MGITKFSRDVLRSQVKSTAWSWGSIDETNGRVFLRIWIHEIRGDPGNETVRVCTKEKTSESRGYAERKRHLAMIENGAAGYAILCTSGGRNKDGNNVLNTFEPRFLRKIGRLIVDQNGDTHAQLLERVTLEDLGLTPEGGSDPGGEDRLPAEELNQVQPQHLRNAVGALLAGTAKHKFGDSTDYDVLLEDGTRLPPKAVFGVAASEALGKEILPIHFSGGDSSTCFRILREAGFTIVPKDKFNESERDEWTTEELLDSVKAYVSMSRYERSQTPFNKKLIYRELAARHPKRSEKSFEYRMQNISYVMTLLGRPWVTGLKPAKNVGLRVAADIERLLALVEGRSADPKVEFEFTVNKARDHQPTTPPQGNRKPAARPSETTQVERDPKVKAWVLENAKGVCECCGKPAPFVTVDGPFLEVHHVWLLAEGGPDTTDNAVALCPNCHRELHLGLDGKAKVEALYVKIARLLRASASASD